LGKLLLIFLTFYFINNTVGAQTKDSIYFVNSIISPGEELLVPVEEFNPKKMKKLIIGFSAGYGTTMYFLQKAWYSYDTKSSFHFYNDNSHWLQMDKAGHFYTSFQQSRLGIEALKWAGVEHKKAVWYGGMLGIVLQTPIEIFDGFSSEYGASIGDMIANTAGSFGIITQELLWKEVRITPKFSFRRSRYEPERLQMFGNTFFENMIQDYNGQTYWLSFNISSITKLSAVPKWLNLAVGYGAEGMIHADPIKNRESGLNAYRQYYLSLDIDLTRIPTKSKVLKNTFYLINTIKIPLPTVEYNSKTGFNSYFIYF
jgi:VanZ family protein